MAKYILGMVCFLLIFTLCGCSSSVQTTLPPVITLQSTLLPTTMPTTTPTPAISPTPKPERAYQKNAQLGRGVNLGNALEAPKEGEWGVTLLAEYFTIIKAGGFQSLRVPINWSAHAGKTAPYPIDTEFFKRVDWVVEQAQLNGLIAILDMHNYAEMMSQPEQEKPRFLALWDQIAEHYQGVSDSLYFEILNEPNSKLNYDLWNKILAEALGTIRRTNPERIPIMGPANWGGLDQLDWLEAPEADQNIIVTFHYYLPFQFTHQGAEWVDGSQAWLGTKWLGDFTNKQLVRTDMVKAAVWSKQHNRPMLLGEFGAYSKGDIESRTRWTDYVARQAEANGFSWAYWEFCAGFGVYDKSTKTWNEPIWKALIP